MDKNLSHKDQIYAASVPPSDFVFDEKVANVFEDMINRSVPGYETIISMIGVLANRYYQRGSFIYDLGCSLGGATFSICESLQNTNFSLIAIDNSSAMIERLEAKKCGLLGRSQNIETRCENIQDASIENASVVVLNFTIQFLPVDIRMSLIKNIYSGMKPGGMLILSEKIIAPDSRVDSLLIDMYHEFKEAKGYSKLEISQKRAALENVLIPETIETHRNRLASADFRSVDVWFQCFNFASIVAIK